MSTASAGWVDATLGDLIAADGVFSDGDWVETKDQDPNGDVRLTQLADVGEGVFRDRSSRFLRDDQAAALNCTFLEPGDVLIARMPDPLGRACLFPGLPQRAVTAVDVCIVRPGSGSVDPRWLMWTINAPTFRARVAEFQTGTTRRRISRKNLARIRLPVPPLNEQLRIVAAIEEHLSRLDAADASLAAALRRLEALRRSALSAAMNGRWVRRPLGEVAQTQLGKMLSRKSKTGVGSRPYLRNKNVQWGRIDTNDLLTMDFTEREAEKFSLEHGDVLICEGGEVGRAAVWRAQVEGCCFQKALHRVRSSGDALPEFIAHVFRWLADTNAFDAYVTGSTIKHLPQEDLRLIPIPVPPLEEQRRIVAEVEERLSVIDAMRGSIERAQRRSRALRAAILERAFRGELVPQDPGDEPAEALLARIRAEREARPVSSGRGRKGR